MSEIALLLGFFFSKNVALVSMLSFNFSCAGHLESLLGAGIGFHLWHCLMALIVESYLLPNVSSLVAVP
jgi:hypothetical protein